MKRLLYGLLILCFTSCSNQDSVLPKQHLRMNIRSEPATLDPRKGGDAISSTLHFMLFEGLVRLNEDDTITLAQAKSYELSSDYKTYTFYLRDSLWSDGTPVTAYDFETSWKDILNPQFHAFNPQLLYAIKNAEAVKSGLLPMEKVGIEAVDEKTLVVRLNEPTPHFLKMIAFCVCFPVSAKKDRAVPEWAHEATPDFVCNGPFKLAAWRHNHEIVLEKNPYYWGAKDVNLESIQISMVNNETTVLEMFVKGKLDLIDTFLSPLPLDAIPTLKKQGDLLIRPSSGSMICAFNTQQFPFHNLNLRRAFALAINRTAIVNNIVQQNEVAALNAIPPRLKDTPSLPLFKDHDVEEARELLKKGMEELDITIDDLSKLTYSYSTTETHQKVAQAIQNQWREVLGVSVNLEKLEQKTLLEKLKKRQFTLAQTVWFAQYHDPINILERFQLKENVKNYSGWFDAGYAELLRSSSTESNETKRMKILELAEKIFIDQMPITPIYHCSTALLIKPYLHNISAQKMGDVEFRKIFVGSPDLDKSKDIALQRSHRKRK